MMCMTQTTTRRQVAARCNAQLFSHQGCLESAAALTEQRNPLVFTMLTIAVVANTSGALYPISHLNIKVERYVQFAAPDGLSCRSDMHVINVS